MSLWTKWMRTTLLSSLDMYSMLSRFITLSPTRSILLMVHLLPPKSRAGTARRIPRPDYLLYALQRRHGTRMYSTTKPSRSCSDSTTRPRNTPAVRADVGALEAGGVRLYAVVGILGRWGRVGGARLCVGHE